MKQHDTTISKCIKTLTGALGLAPWQQHWGIVALISNPHRRTEITRRTEKGREAKRNELDRTHCAREQDRTQLSGEGKMAQMRHCCVVIRCICLSRRMNHGVRRNAKSKAEIKLQAPARRANNERGSKGSDCGNNDKIGRVAVVRSQFSSKVAFAQVTNTNEGNTARLVFPTTTCTRTTSTARTSHLSKFLCSCLTSYMLQSQNGETRSDPTESVPANTVCPK